ncbi:MAG: hypothetical protein ACJAZO_001018 [Myxococcota bacterium]|jgi:hypothetical protein
MNVMRTRPLFTSVGRTAHGSLNYGLEPSQNLHLRPIPAFVSRLPLITSWPTNPSTETLPPLSDGTRARIGENNHFGPAFIFSSTRGSTRNEGRARRQRE